jgi:phenylalanyl-tRNA synthetase beta chain
MYVSLNWLTDYVDVAMPAPELAELFTRVGIPCDGFTETEADIVFDLEITSNRPDLLGHLGIARELAAATGAALRPPEIPALPTRGEVSELTSVEVLDPDLCPRYTARVIRGVKVGPSPGWLVERLEAVGLRGINNVVDVTNYVLFEYSQPLHSFDYDKLAENRIVVRRARPGELMVSIDGTKCHLDERMLIIADAGRPVAIAGVMGGLETEVGGATANVLIESAQFDPLTTRRTARKLGILSEANYRFERGVDPVRLDEASLRACRLIIDLAGGELAEGVADVWARPFAPAEVAMRPRRCNALLGVNVPVERQAAILERLGLAPRVEDETIICTIPSHRGDLKREADLIEEVARLEGYDKIPVAGKVAHGVAVESEAEQVRRLLGRAMAAAGFDEALTFGFVSDEEAELFGHAETVRVDPATRRTSNVLRPTLLPSLLVACKANQDAGNHEVCLYELASVFPPAPGEGPHLPAERVDVGMATTCGLRVLRGALEAVVAAVAPKAKLDVRQAALAGFDDAAGVVFLDGEPAGEVGLASHAVQRHFGLERPVAAAAVRFGALLERASLKRSYEPLPKFPPVRRDLSVIVDEPVTWRELAAAVESVSQPLRASVEYVTTYRGPQAGEGRKSVTLTLVYRSVEQTLRGEQVDEQVAEVSAALREKLGAGFRA